MTNWLPLEAFEEKVPEKSAKTLEERLVQGTFSLNGSKLEPISLEIRAVSDVRKRLVTSLVAGSM